MNTSSISNVGFNEKHSAGIRIWHWLFFLLIAAAMITVLLASTTFRTGNNTEMVRQELQQKQLIADKDQSRAVAHAFNDKLWDLHRYIGYFIAAFLLARLVLEFVQPPEEKIRCKMKMAREADTRQQQEMRHYIMVKRGYLLFYALILIMAVTGLGLAFEDVPLFRDMRKMLKQIHSLTQYGIYAFVLFHIVGVVMADAGEYPGLVSGMIHGKRRNMKAYLCCFLFFGGVADTHTAAPPVWHLNMREAREIAQKEHRYILLNFSGSDWCGPCIMLRKEIFDDPVFGGFADTALVLVNADFPRMKKNQLSKEQQQLNDQLADRYNSQGKFPLTLLLNAEGKVVKEWDGNPSVKAEVFDAQVEMAIQINNSK